jgi:hypothetical protein
LNSSNRNNNQYWNVASFTVSTTKVTIVMDEVVTEQVPDKPKRVSCSAEPRLPIPCQPEHLGANVGNNPETQDQLQMIMCWIPDGRLATVRGMVGMLVHTDLGLFDINKIKPARVLVVDPSGLQIAEMLG